MKKIFFSDKLGLTKAVLDGRKTMTRRAVPMHDYKYGFEVWYDTETKQCCVCDGSFIVERSRYSVGEVIAIAQAYEDVYAHYIQTAQYKKAKDVPENTAGEGNKMFVKADLMPHRIKITSIRVEHLQEISNEDCLREGVDKYKNGKYIIFMVSGIMQKRGIHKSFRTPREAFAALIDKVSGRGTWQSNPLVWVYQFELLD